MKKPDKLIMEGLKQSANNWVARTPRRLPPERPSLAFMKHHYKRLLKVLNPEDPRNEELIKEAKAFLESVE